MAFTFTGKNHPMVPVDLIFPFGGQSQRKLILVKYYTSQINSWKIMDLK